MNQLEYLKLAFQHRAYKKKAFLLSLITIGFDEPANKTILAQLPYALYVEDNHFHFNDHKGVNHTLEGDVKQPYLKMNTHLNLPNDFHPILRNNEITTTFGIFLFNIILLWEPLNQLLPYENKEFTKGMLKAHITNLAVDDPEEGMTVPEGKVPMRDILKISRNMNYLEGLLSAIVKCGSQTALTVSKEVVALKNKLLKENKDKLSDPVVFNNIVKQCVDLDYEIQMKGESATFYISKDYVTNCRKRMFVMFGIEYNSETNSWVPIVDPLISGWNPALLTDYINTAIEGSYNRGKATGEGGAKVKDTLRIMSSKRVTDVDCGSLAGEPLIIREYNKHYWQGTNIIEGNKVIMLNSENVNQYVNKTVIMRAPQFCLTVEGNYCRTCLGKGLGSSTTRLASDVTQVSTIFMLLRMKQSHISGSSNSKIVWEDAFK